MSCTNPKFEIIVFGKSWDEERKKLKELYIHADVDEDGEGR